VLSTVDFNDQSGFKTNKVRDVRTDRELPTKRIALKEMRPQPAPNSAFGFRHVASKRART
jgi:hypothetical protein